MAKDSIIPIMRTGVLGAIQNVGKRTFHGSNEPFAILRTGVGGAVKQILKDSVFDGTSHREQHAQPVGQRQPGANGSMNNVYEGVVGLLTDIDNRLSAISEQVETATAMQKDTLVTSQKIMYLLSSFNPNQDRQPEQAQATKVKSEGSFLSGVALGALATAIWPYLVAAAPWLTGLAAMYAWWQSVKSVYQGADKFNKDLGPTIDYFEKHGWIKPQKKDNSVGRFAEPRMEFAFPKEDPKDKRLHGSMVNPGVQTGDQLIIKTPKKIIFKGAEIIFDSKKITGLAVGPQSRSIPGYQQQSAPGQMSHPSDPYSMDQMMRNMDGRGPAPGSHGSPQTGYAYPGMSPPSSGSSPIGSPIGSTSPASTSSRTDIVRPSGQSRLQFGSPQMFGALESQMQQRFAFGSGLMREGVTEYKAQTDLTPRFAFGAGMAREGVSAPEQDAQRQSEGPQRFAFGEGVQRFFGQQDQQQAAYRMHPGSTTRLDEIPPDGRYAAVRYHNPGAQYPSKRAELYGQTGFGYLRSQDGTHKIANFPSDAHGAAANFDNWKYNGYRGLTLRDAVARWRGRGSPVPAGFDPNMRVTDELLNDKEQMIRLFKGMSKHEGRGNAPPVTDQQWEQAWQWYQAGGIPDPDKKQASVGSMLSQIPAARPEQTRMASLTGEPPMTPIPKDALSVPKFTEQQQMSRPFFMSGQLSVPAVGDFKSQSYRVGSGGGGWGSVPFGSFPVSPTRGSGPDITRLVGPSSVWHVGSKESNYQHVYDPKTGRTRTAIQIHKATHLDKLYSAGCIAIDPQQYSQFRKHMEALSAQYGSVILDVSPSPKGKAHGVFAIRIPGVDAPQHVASLTPDQAIDNFKRSGHVDQSSGSDSMPTEEDQQSPDAPTDQLDPDQVRKLSEGFTGLRQFKQPLPDAQLQTTVPKVDPVKELQTKMQVEQTPQIKNTESVDKPIDRMFVMPKADMLSKMHPSSEYNDPRVAHPVVTKERPLVGNQNTQNESPN